jgi:TolB-like protein
MERKTFVAFALLIGLSAAVYGQERLAVLDTVLPTGITRSVILPVNEKIMEEFVRSKAFTVVDCAFIEKTLSEQEFSLSDLVADEVKLAEFGGFLRATYIVVSTVERIETRYFLSAKMIIVKTGVIAAQASANRDGTATVLIDLAEEVAASSLTPPPANPPWRPVNRLVRLAPRSPDPTTGSCRWI